VIVTAGGENIYPEELEQYFMGDIIKEILVQEHNGRLVALVYSNDNPLTFQYMKQLNDRLPMHKMLHEFKILQDPFVRNSQLKIMRSMYKYENFVRSDTVLLSL
jgi:long-subunit acyl-CoA synthetase (AMP-forming)